MQRAKMIFKSIRFKLWLTFFITLVLSLSAMLVVSHRTTQKRFIEYSLQSLEEQLPPLEARLVAIHRRAGSLEPLKDNSRLWHQIVGESIFYGHILEERFPKKPRGPSSPFGPKLDPRFHELKKNQKSFVRSLALFSNDKSPIAGQLKPNCEQHWHPVYDGETVIAHIAFEVPRHPIRRSQQEFLDRQLNQYIHLMLLMSVAALIVAVLVSRWLIRPLQELSHNAQRLSTGDFGTRVKIHGHDELGQLCKNFNEMAAKLESNEMNRRQWVADISHEMRTPLSVLKAQIEALQDGVRPANKENLSLLASRIDSLNHLINDLFDLALSDLGALKYEKKETDLNCLMSEFVHDNQDRVDNAGFQFRFKSDEDGQCHGNIDRNRFLQVFENLLENSLRYTEAPGVIEWSLSCTAREIHATFEDSAPGVGEEFLDKIFDRLYRMEQSRNRESGGAGLGLSLCKNIVEAHDGKMCAHMSKLGGLKIEIILQK
jgi:two-component system sensor histidine kinase BaeS